MEKRILNIGVDIDGVVRDLYHPLVSIFREKLPNEQIKDVKEWDDYRVAAHTSVGARIYKLWFVDWAVKLYSTAPAYNEVIRDLVLLRELGHKIHYISAQPNQLCELLTLEWLQNEVIYYDSVHFTQEKWRIECDAYVDDSPEQLRNYTTNGKLAFKYMQPWNRGFLQCRPILRLKNLPEEIWAMKRSG